MAAEGVTFLEIPVEGQRARVLKQGQPAVTSTVVRVQTHPNYPGWY